ncbi:MAG: SGNH/GDSL hydrolase family protein [Burkholderiales bacterium]
MAKRRRGKFNVPRMWQIVGVSGLAIVVAVLVGVAVQPTPLPPVPEGYVRPSNELPPVAPTVVFIGDSYTGGSDMGGRGDANWTAVAADTLGWRDCSFGVGGSGWTVGASGWTYGARVDWALSRHPSLIVFSNGINDVKGDAALIGPAAAEALAYLRSKDADVPVVVVGPMQVQNFPALYVMNDGVAAASAANTATFVDAVAGGWFTGADRVYVGTDQFHPTDEGHVYLAQKFIDSLAAAGIVLEDVPREDRVPCAPPNPSQVAADGTPVNP